MPAFQEPRRDQAEVGTKPEVEVERIADREGGLVLELRQAPRRFQAWRCAPCSPGAPPWAGQWAPKRRDGEAEDHRADDERVDADSRLQPRRREHGDAEEHDGREGEEAERPRDASLTQ